MDGKISTSAEALEGSALPRLGEVHTNPAHPGATSIELPAKMQEPIKAKSPAQWAYERLILYIQKFEETLDSEHEVAMGFAGGDTGVLRIEGMGFFDPDIVTFYGSDPAGTRMQLVQHVSQLSVMLRALPKPAAAQEASRIGFRLAAALEPGASEGRSAEDASSEPNPQDEA